VYSFERPREELGHLIFDIRIRDCQVQAPAQHVLLESKNVYPG